jgi:type I restriction enzyme S subunit
VSVSNANSIKNSLGKISHYPLKELCTFSRGKWIKAELLTPGKYPVVTSGQRILEYHNEFNREGQSITIASSGAYAGFVNFWDEPIYLSNAFTVEPIDTSILRVKFLFHFLKNNQDFIHNLSSTGGVPNVYPHDLYEMSVPVPPTDIQDAIIEILENFMSLESLLTNELELRRQQLQYYRSSLLDHPEEI